MVPCAFTVGPDHRIISVCRLKERSSKTSSLLVVELSYLKPLLNVAHHFQFTIFYILLCTATHVVCGFVTVKTGYNVKILVGPRKCLDICFFYRLNSSDWNVETVEWLTGNPKNLLRF